MSTRYNTGNPIESTDVRDMSDNAKNFDEFSNSMSDSFTDRLGRDRQTIEGSIRKAGFQPASFDFVSGGALFSGDRNRAVFNPSPSGDDNWYAWQGAFPKIISPNSTPATSGGLGENAWKPVTNNILDTTVRESIRRSYASAGLKLVTGSFQAGFTLVNANDVALDEATGKAFSGPSGNYPPETSTAGFIDRSSFLQSSGYTSFTHDQSSLYDPASVGFRLRLKAYITDSPYNAVMGGGVTDAQAELNASALQSAIDSGVPVQIPAGGLRLKRPAGVASVVAVYPNTTIIGASRRHGLSVTSGTEVLVDCPQNGQLFELKDRAGQAGDGQGTLCLRGVSFINTGSYLSFTSSGPDKYYTPTPINVLNANTRGLWASESAPATDWGGYSDWRAKKDGGVNCPFLTIKDIKFQNFAFPLDVHTWMASIDGFETYLCGPIRLYGTSVDAVCVWPRYPLSAAFQTRLQYSTIQSSSLGEKQTSLTGGGLQNYGGVVNLRSVGYEEIKGLPIDCYGGTVIVDGIEAFVSSIDRPQNIGMVHSETAFIRWKSIPKCVYSDGTLAPFSFKTFASSTEALLGNHIVEFSSNPNETWVSSPWLSKVGSYSGALFEGPYPTNDSGLDNGVFTKFPSKLNRLREVACLHIEAKDSVILRGTSQRIVVDICGPFTDDVGGPADVNPRQKFGNLLIKIRPMAAQNSTGVSVTGEFTYAEYSLSFSVTSAGKVVMEKKSGDGFSATKVVGFYTDGVNNGGIRATLGLEASDAEHNSYAQAIARIEYEGSHNNTMSSSDTVKIRVV